MRVPSYRRHSSGQARVTINGKDHLLGPYGSPQSKEAYGRLIAEYSASGAPKTFGESSRRSEDGGPALRLPPALQGLLRQLLRARQHEDRAQAHDRALRGHSRPELRRHRVQGHPGVVAEGHDSNSSVREQADEAHHARHQVGGRRRSHVVGHSLGAKVHRATPPRPL